MRLGDVFNETTAPEVETPTAPTRRTKRRLLLVIATFAALGYAGWLHGPGVLTLAPGQTALVTNHTHLSGLGAPHRVVKDTALVWYLPVLQSARRLPQPEVRSLRLNVDARAADGALIQLRQARLSYIIRPQEAAGCPAKDAGGWCISQLPQARWDAAVLIEARAVLFAALAQTSPMTRTSKETLAALHDAGRTLGDRLALRGVSVTAFTAPTWRLNQEAELAAAALYASQRALLTAAQADADAQVAEIAELKATEATALEALSARKAQHATARLALEDELGITRRDGAAYAATRALEAKAHHARLMARAKAEQGAGQARAAAFNERVAAIGDNGPALLDRTIAAEVIPQLVRLRAGLQPQPSAEMTP